MIHYFIAFSAKSNIIHYLNGSSLFDPLFAFKMCFFENIRKSRKINKCFGVLVQAFLHFSWLNSVFYCPFNVFDPFSQKSIFNFVCYYLFPIRVERINIGLSFLSGDFKIRFLSFNWIKCYKNNNLIVIDIINLVLGLKGNITYILFIGTLNRCWNQKKSYLQKFYKKNKKNRFLFHFFH